MSSAPEPAPLTTRRAGLARRSQHALHASALLFARAKLAERGTSDEDRALALQINANDRLVALLDLVDRKASSLVGANSFLLAANAFVLRGVLDGGASATVDRLPTAIAALGAAACVIAITMAVALFRLRWGLVPDAAESDVAILTREVDALARLTADRLAWLRALRWATIAAVGLASAAATLIILR